MFVLHRGAGVGSSGVSAGALHPPDAQSAVFEAAVLSVAWSGGAVAPSLGEPARARASVGAR